MNTYSRTSTGLVAGIDAANLRSGGGVTHLVELIAAADPERHGFAKIVVWGSTQTLSKLPERSWLEKVNTTALNQRLIQRMLWQRFRLPGIARSAQCDVLFVPGGSYAGNFKPVVTMSRNILPFEWCELWRYGWSLMTIRLLLLRYIQCRSFRRAGGVIFLTEYACRAVQKVTGPISGQITIIPHGLNPRFQIKPKQQRPIGDYTETNPFRLLYVSIIDQYKHQWHVVEAVHALRQDGFPVEIHLVGPAYPPALRRLQDVLSQLDPEGQWARYHGAVPYESLHEKYAQSDIGIFASSCENMPNILLETMAAGLPVVCSNRGPMPEILGDTGLYFDPENPAELTQVIKRYIESPGLRNEKAQASFLRCQQYSWERCAGQTINFLAQVARSA